MRVTPTLAGAVLLSLAASCGDSDCQCVSPTASWASLAPLSLGPRQEMGVAAIAGEVYVVDLNGWRKCCASCTRGSTDWPARLRVDLHL